MLLVTAFLVSFFAVLGSASATSATLNSQQTTQAFLKWAVIKKSAGYQRFLTSLYKNKHQNISSLQALATAGRCFDSGVNIRIKTQLAFFGLIKANITFPVTHQYYTADNFSTVNSGVALYSYLH